MSNVVLVTGSSGHLGSALMQSLPSFGYDPIGLDLLPSPTTTVVGSVSDSSLLSTLFASHSFYSVLHAATLHKPHIGSHSKLDFIDVNIRGTTLLLEHAFASKCNSFVFTSSTTTFGRSLAPLPGSPAAWIDEDVVPRPKNIYGVTKVCAEDICDLIHRQTGMPIIVLRTSRFFPEGDDVEERRQAYSDHNLKVNELSYRRVDIADVVSAHVNAMEKAREVGWGKYIISAPPPFAKDQETLRQLDFNAQDAMRITVPLYEQIYAKVGWKFLDRIDRVYDSSKAIRELGWSPIYTYERALNQVSKGEEWRSDLTLQVGTKGYHAEPTGVYTTVTTATSVPAKACVRLERSGDVQDIRQLLISCFDTTYEADLVDTLRLRGKLSISLLAMDGLLTVSHVALSPMRSPEGALGLAPVTTMLSHRKRGLAALLISQAIEWARSEGCWNSIFVVGDPAFYSRFGFAAQLAQGFQTPYSGPHLMALELKPGALTQSGGPLLYDEAF